MHIFYCCWGKRVGWVLNFFDSHKTGEGLGLGLVVYKFENFSSNWIRETEGKGPVQREIYSFNKYLSTDWRLDTSEIQW